MIAEITRSEYDILFEALALFENCLASAKDIEDKRYLRRRVRRMKEMIEKFKDKEGNSFQFSVDDDYRFEQQ